MKKRRAILALALLVPIPSVGVTMGMIVAPNTALGAGLFAFSKVWILLLPLVWRLCVDQERLSGSRPAQGGLGPGLLLGMAISAIILATYMSAGQRLIDRQGMRDMMAQVGLGDRRVYLGAAAYWILVNSVLEEYVWRWFVVTRLYVLASPRCAIAASALAFTLHHILAMSVYFGWTVVAIASCGVFIGGAAWSWCYARYQSIWPGYLSHAVVDLTVFAIGYHIIFC